MSDCQICGCEIEVKVGICAKCHGKIFCQLDDLLELWMAAHGELMPGSGGRGSSSGEITAGFHVGALSFITGDDILGRLHSWEVIIRRELVLTPPALLEKLPLANEVHDAIKFAQIYLEWSGTQPWIVEFADEVKDIYSAGMSGARKFTEKVTNLRCATVGNDGTICRATIKRQTDILSTFTCRRCGSSWNTVQLILASLSQPDVRPMLDAEAMSLLIGVTPRRIRQIAKQHGVKKCGFQYDLKHIIALRHVA